MKIKMGIYDAPRKAERGFFTIDTWRDNIAVFGDSGFGKTTFIKKLLFAAETGNIESRKEGKKRADRFFILDFNSDIGAFSKLGSVMAYFDNSNEEHIRSRFHIIDRLISGNAEKMGGMHYRSFAEKYPDKVPDHFTLIIDGVNSFLLDEKYIKYHEKLEEFCREGQAKGLNVVIAANNLSGINSRLMANFRQKVAFAMSDDDYYSVFNARVEKPMRVKGRCLANIGSDIYETQIFLPLLDKNFDKVVEEQLEKRGRKATYYHAFPSTVTMENITEYLPRVELQEKDIPVGLDYRTHKLLVADIDTYRTVAIYGSKARTDSKVNLISGLLKGIPSIDQDVRFVFLEDRRNTLGALYEKHGSRSLKADSIEEFFGLLSRYGYIDTIRTDADGNEFVVPVQENPFTVFLMQSRDIYQGSSKAANLIRMLKEDLTVRAHDNNYLFIFTDVQTMDYPQDFNDMIDVAYLFDDIYDVVAGQSKKTVFGNLDERDLKNEYAKNAKGDSYYYNVQSDRLIKARFIKF